MLQVTLPRQLVFADSHCSRPNGEWLHAWLVALFAISVTFRLPTCVCLCLSSSSGLSIFSFSLAATVSVSCVVSLRWKDSRVGLSSPVRCYWFFSRERNVPLQSIPILSCPYGAKATLVTKTMLQKERAYFIAYIKLPKIILKHIGFKTINWPWLRITDGRWWLN